MGGGAWTLTAFPLEWPQQKYFILLLGRNISCEKKKKKKKIEAKKEKYKYFRLLFPF